MEYSILNTIKKMLGLDANYTAFDTDIIVHINSALMTLTQLGVGSPSGFSITSSLATWQDFIGTASDLEAIKSFIYLKTRLAFDPPATSFVLEAIKAMISEYEWRINVQVDTEPLPLEGGSTSE